MPFKDSYILTHLESLSITYKLKKLLFEIIKINEEKGYKLNSERNLILLSSLRYLGKRYLQTEELNNNTIDCSTLVSQSFWEGAFITVPFIAESHRTSQNAVVVEFHNLKPGDVVIKYNKLEDSNDKKHNHIALYLGESLEKQHYVIEAKSSKGCIISTLENFDPMGGFRSYIKNENLTVRINSINKNTIISRMVPKLGRLGARQYLINSKNRIKHRGVDIYVYPNTNIFAPIDGCLKEYYLENEDIKGYKIINNKHKLEIVLANINIDSKYLNKSINKNTKIGKTTEIISNSRIIYSKIENRICNLHFQAQGNLKSHLSIDGFRENNLNYYNGLYLSKLKIINLPFKL